MEKSIIFDVDGTLWDTTEIVADAWNEAIKGEGSYNAEVTPDRLKQLFGKPMNVIARELFGEMTPETEKRLLEICCEKEDEHLLADNKNLLYPAVRETIIELAKTHRLFIVSNCQKGYIELFLKKAELGEYIVDFECYGNTGEGKGSNIKRLVERNCLEHPYYIGDTQGDCDACAEAGVPFIFAAYGFGKTDSFIAEIKSFDELLTIF